MKRGHVFLLSYISYCNKRLLSSFQSKLFPLNPASQIDAIIVKFCSFLKFGILLHLALLVIQTSLLLNEDKCFVPISLQLQTSVMIITIYVRYQNNSG